MKQHYTITVPAPVDSFERDYTDGIMAESLKDAVIKFDECLDLSGYTKEEITSFITAI